MDTNSRPDTGNPAPALSPGVESQLREVRRLYDGCEKRPHFSKAYLQMLSRYLRRIIPSRASLLEVGCGGGELLELLGNKDSTGIDLSPGLIERARERLPGASFSVGSGESFEAERQFDIILLSDVLNEAGDAQQILERMHAAANPNTRLVVNFHNTVWRPLLGLATRMGLTRPRPRGNWLSREDVANLLHVAGWEVVRKEARIVVPHPLFGIGTFFNSILSPFLSWFCLILFMVARPVKKPQPDKSLPSVSVIVPARNEAGNIKSIVERVPDMGAWTEIVFVEGNSSDGTWEEIQKIIAANPDKRIRAFQQGGRGKGDAMRTGYAQAAGDLFIILDADMTVPPEDLPKFYNALAEGKGEFINGVRLVYPLEDESMRFLNMCGNKFFSLLFSWLLGQPIKDTLCGTKAFSRENYHKIEASRSYFGDFDPFGDFDLLFGAAHNSLRIVDIPIRYQSREYGETQIDRWRDGILLFKMAGYAARKVKFI